MKRLLLCVLLALGMLGQSAAAQAVAKEQQSAASVVAGDGTSDNATAVVRGWNRPYVSFNASKVNSSVNDLLDFDLRGFTLGWLRGFGIAKKVPLYLEAGAGLQFRTMKEGIDMADGSDVASLDTRINLLSLHIPVSLIYRFTLPGGLSVSPYAGLDFRANLMGKLKVDASFNDMSDGLDISLFDKGDMDDHPWNRCQGGWHAGVGFGYGIVHVGVDYGRDFNELGENMTMGTTSVTVGLNF